MRARSAIPAIASLLCGLVLTVVVAFACSLWSRTAQTRNQITHDLPADIAPLIPKEWLVSRFPPSPTHLGLGYLVNGHSGFGLQVLEFAVNESIPGYDKFDFDHRGYVR